jgi:Ala-tRNA(Pro) deacylase
MPYIGEITTEAPEVFLTPLQKKTYETLALLNIPFQRVETSEIVTMEECLQVNKKLDMEMVKTLFLCNRKKTEFYLFILSGSKNFRSKLFSNALDVPRVSFAAPETMEEMLGVTIGAATVFGLLLDVKQKIRVIFDDDVVREKWYGCSDGTTTGYMKVETKLIVHDFLRHVKHPPTIIKI